MVNPFATRVGEILRGMKKTKGPSKGRDEARRRFAEAAARARRELGVPRRRTESAARSAKRTKAEPKAVKHRRSPRGIPPSAIKSFRHPTTRSVPGVTLFGGFSSGFWPDQSISYVSGARTGASTNTGSMQGLSAKLPSGSAFVRTAVRMNGLKKHLISAGVIDG